MAGSVLTLRSKFLHALGLGTVLAMLLVMLVHEQGWAQPGLPVYNRISYEKARKAHPDFDFIDLKRSTTVRITEAGKKDAEPLVWEYVKETERISLSNQRYHQVYFLKDDFVELTDTQFWRIKDKKKQVPKPEPRNIMLDNNEIFHQNYRLSVYDIPVTYPGEILQSRLSYTYKSLMHGGIIEFAEGWPANEAVVRLEVPKWLQFRVEEVNFDKFEIQVEKEEQGDLMVYTYTISNLPASKPEPYAVGEMYYMPFLIVIPEAMDHPKRGQANLLKSIDDDYQWKKNLANKADNQPESLQAVVASLTNGKDSLAQIEAIYYWVQDNIRYIAFEDGWSAFIPDNCQNVLSKRYGDCKGMANLIKQMLLLAGFDARLVWIGTRDKVALPIDMPTVANSNHMIAAVRHGGSWLYLDGTSSFQPLAEYPDQIQGQGVMIEGLGATDYELSKVPVHPADHNRLSSTIHLALAADGSTLLGTQELQLQGYPRTIFKSIYNGVPNNKKEDFLREYMSAGQEYKGFQEIVLNLGKDRADQVDLSAKVLFQGQVLVLGDELYLPSTIHKRFKYSALEEDRLSDLSLGQRLLNTDTVVYQVPSGYVVSSLPAPVAIETDYYRFSLQIEERDGHLVSLCTIHIKDFIIPKSAFADWNAAIKAIKTFYNDQIILKKS